MFNVGDEVFIKNSQGLKGVILNKVRNHVNNDCLVKTELFEKWYHENELKLASTISKTETVPKFIKATRRKVDKLQNSINTTTTDYTIKSDQDKAQLHLVPISQLWTAIARVREYGVAKYGDNDSWKKVEIKRYHDALLRHTAAIAQDLNAVDEESGLPHRWHIACNLAFIEYLIGGSNV